MPSIMIPKSGSKWLHKSGKQYTVAIVANITTTKPEEYPPTVVYFDDNDEWWARPLVRWHSSMTLMQK